MNCRSKMDATQSIPLGAIIEGLACRVVGASDCAIHGLAYHSAAVQPGALFFALPGAKVDGQAFVDDAMRRGAVAVVTERAMDLPSHVTSVQVSNAREAMARCAARWFADPTMQLRLIGVTGTNGKTTTTYLLESIWQAQARASGVIGTVNYRYGDTVLPAPTTTPESYDVQALCCRMRDAGVTDVAMEVSSHALTQHRVTACRFDGAIFTNLSQDHLDYHADMTAYAQAKRRLFAEVLGASRKADRFAVINADDPASTTMMDGCVGRVITYGMEAPADCSPVRFTSTLDGIGMDVRLPDGVLPIRSPLLGRFNGHNILAAVAAAWAMRIPAVAIAEGVARLAVVPGRLERVAAMRDVTVLVDYAHTPDALQHVVGTLRGLALHRLITVFGCGGDRDRAKRPLMGAAAAQESDLVIVTSDNPRSEDPYTIMAQIVPGVRRYLDREWTSLDDTAQGRGYCVEVDRSKAIAQALAWARPGDMVLVAGKGHEDYQIIGSEKRHFDDREVVRAWVHQHS